MLAELRGRSFTPSAWMAFLGASFRRSWADARSRPDLERAALVAGSLGVVGWGAASAFEPRALWGLAWWGLVVAMLWTHLGMVQGLGGERRDGIGLPNYLTLLRAALVPAAAFLVSRPAAFAAVLAVAFATDALDGPLARLRGGETRLGVHSDAAVDVALVLVAAWSAQGAGWLPLWAALLVTARYVAPPALAAVHYFALAAPPSHSKFVHGRAPGALVAAGLLLVVVEPFRTAGAVVVALGVVGGVATAGLSIARTWRQVPA